MTTNLKERAREFLHKQVIQLWESQEAYDKAVANLSALLTQVQAEARLVALEEAAKVIDQCNREGPYNAIQGVSRIRALAQAAAPATKEE